jgi:predicted acetylornithine/succinylornithine family transaminase
LKTQESTMNAEEIIQAESELIVPTYVRPPIVFARGEGAYLFDTEGKSYLDMTAGIAVTALGHSDPEWADVVAEQAGELTHISNLYHSAPHVELAARLVDNSFADRVYYCNSGTEANEAAIKFARKWARSQGRDGRTGIVAFEGGFHGRTIGALSVTAKARYRDPFAPLMPGVTFAPFNDLAAAAEAVTREVCAVIVEPIQGEGGVRPAEHGFLQGLRRLCDEQNVLLIMDEVQCGLGRTGTLWAHEGYGVAPDVMTIAKPLAGGLPIGATLVTEEVARVMEPGDHGSTFAAGPLVCRAAQVVVDRINRPGFLAAVQANGAHLRARLETLRSAKLVEVRGAGLLLGIEFSVPVKPLISAAAEQGVLLISAGENVLRLCPPLIVTRAQLDRAVDVIGECLEVLG